MQPRKPALRSDELFRSQLDNMINMEHAPERVNDCETAGSRD